MRDLQADPPLLTDEELNALMSEDAPVTYDTDVWSNTVTYFCW